MKKAFLVIMFVLITVGAFAQNYPGIDEMIDVYTSEGAYAVSFGYLGMNQGEQYASKRSNLGYAPFKGKLTNGQWECVNKALARYKNSMGDTFRILIQWFDAYKNHHAVQVILEFTSNTQYKYWLFETL